HCRRYLQYSRCRGRWFSHWRGREPGGFVHFNKRHCGGAIPGDSYSAHCSASRSARWENSGEESMKPSADTAITLAALCVLAGLPFFASGYVLFIANLLMIYVILALGLHIVLGETGQFALSHIAFYG